MEKQYAKRVIKLPAAEIKLETFLAESDLDYTLENTY